VSTSGAEPAVLTSEYEALRDQATGKLPPLTPWGLTLFLAEGLPGWMKAWTVLPAKPTAPVPTAHAQLPVELGSDMVRLLTEMALGCQRECIS
jgi:hypothetical protein